MECFRARLLLLAAFCLLFLLPARALSSGSQAGARQFGQDGLALNGGGSQGNGWVSASTTQAGFLANNGSKKGNGALLLQTTSLTETVGVAYLPLVLVPEEPKPPPPTEEELVEQYVMAELNGIRASYGLPPLTIAAELTQAARVHSRDMADNNITSHTGSDGSSPYDRIVAAGYDPWTWGEIIGWGFSNSDAMINWWMHSDPHRSLILSTYVEDFGAGYVSDSGSTYGRYWTVNFGARKTTTNTSQSTNLVACSKALENKDWGTSLLFYNPQTCPN